MNGIDLNEDFRRALRLLDSGRSAFITGRAGTGKSTLLGVWRDQQQESGLAPVVTAPTGVAALNVGGATIHRVFRFGPAIAPEEIESGRWHPGAGAELLANLRTLVIDEVSMCRADLLDAVDAALRRYGPDPGLPFGGVQLVMFGDPYQLPPVVRDEESGYFATHYTTPFFFGSAALRRLEFEVVELRRVYRQSDPGFVGLLNRVREGTVTPADLEVLASRVDRDFDPPGTGRDRYVTLTTTNRDADRVNRRHLDQLPEVAGVFRAESAGEVRPADRPTDELLELKPGAQVMLLNNDPLNRWVNGSLAVVSEVLADSVLVRLLDPDPDPGAGAGTGAEVEVGPVTWEVQRPVLVAGRIRNLPVGEFRQLPVRLGWAVTIHKAQGKTLPRTIVDLGARSFADGQTYVALSRCGSLAGLVLRRPVRRTDIRASADVRRFLRGRIGPDDPGGPVSRGWAAISVITTGSGAHDRILEIAVELIDHDGSRQRFDTLINPTRDVGDFREHGIAAGDVTHAPTFAEAWPFLARRLHGYTLVAHGLNQLLRVLDVERRYAPELDVDWGDGVCTIEQLGAAAAAGTGRAGDTAAARVAEVAGTFGSLDTDGLAAVPVQVAESAAVGRLLPRPGSVVALPAVNPGVPDAANYADLLAAALTDPAVDGAAVAELAAQFQLGPGTSERIHHEFAELAAAAVRRDQLVSEAELAHLELVFAAIGVDLPADLQATTEPELAIPQPGWRVCFTGTAVGPDGTSYERDDLLARARELGLQPMKSVTRSTDLLVVADRASLSGKARRARAHGTPIMTVPQWLDWAAGSGGGPGPEPV